MHSVGDMTAVILAGGLGTRLQSVVSDRPKALVEIGGKPFLSWLLEDLQSQGIRKVVLCTGHMAEQIEAAYGACFGKLEIVYSREASPLGTGGALRAAGANITSNTFLLLNGDSFIRFSLPEFLNFHRASGASLSMLLTRVESAGRYGTVRMQDSRIVEFVEKTGRDVPGWINAGVYLCERGILATFPSTLPLSIEKDVFPLLMRTGMAGYQSAGSEFIDIGIPAALAAAAPFFRELQTTRGLP